MSASWYWTKILVQFLLLHIQKNFELIFFLWEIFVYPLILRIFPNLEFFWRERKRMKELSLIDLNNDLDPLFDKQGIVVWLTMSYFLQDVYIRLMEFAWISCLRYYSNQLKHWKEHLHSRSYKHAWHKQFLPITDVKVSFPSSWPAHPNHFPLQ